MNETMTLEALERAMERVRAQMRRVVASLRDPDESARRRARRASVFARWVETLEPMPARMGPMRALGLERWVETLEVAPAQMRSIRALADGADRALFADEALAADGWRRDADGH